MTIAPFQSSNNVNLKIVKSGAMMPLVQFVTYKIKGEHCYTATFLDLQAGYQGIDTASFYDNGKEVKTSLMYNLFIFYRQIEHCQTSQFLENFCLYRPNFGRVFLVRLNQNKAKCEAEVSESPGFILLVSGYGTCCEVPAQNNLSVDYGRVGIFESSSDFRVRT